MAVVAPLAVAAYYGALSIPRSDDWSYLLTLFRWVDHGTLGFNNWVSMTLVGQLALAAPVALVLPNSITAVHVASALVGFVGLVALVVGTERPYRRGAMVLALAIAVGPLWPPLAATYMTDVPAFAVQCVFLALAFHVLRGPTTSVTRYAVALAVGFLAIAIRQYEAIPVAAVVVVTLVVAVRRRERLTGLLVATGVTVLATVALFAWWLSLPDALSLAPSPVTSGLLPNLAVRLGGFVRLVGLLLVPVVLLAGPVRVMRRSWRAGPVWTLVAGGGTALWMAVSYLRVPDVPFVGNYVGIYGVLARDVLTGPRSPVIPTTLFRLLAVVGSAAAVVLAVAVVPALLDAGRRIATRDLGLRDPVTTVLGVSITGFTLAYSFAIATDLPVFDRYALPVLPLVGLLLVRRRPDDDPGPHPGDAADATTGERPSRWARRGAVVALVGLAAVGLAYSTDSASFDGTRWRLDREVARQGWPAGRIYGGFEWISWHQEEGPPQGDTSAERIRLRARYLAPFCIDVIINPGPKKTREAIARDTVHGLGHSGEPIVAVRNDKPCRGITPVPSGG